MATASNTGTDDGRPSSPFRTTAQFKPFEWVQVDKVDAAQRHRAAFLNDARDVVQGAQTLVQLLGWDEDRRDAAVSNADPAPLLDAPQRESLRRLLAASLNLLHGQVEAQCEALTG